MMQNQNQLPHRQKQLLNFIRVVFEARSRAPTYTEIMLRFGMTSRGHVHWLLHELERKGFIEINYKRKYGIKRCKSPAGSSHSSSPSYSAVSATPS